MLRTRLFVSAVTIAIGLTAASPLAAQRSTTLPNSQLLSRFGLEIAWWNQAVLNPGRDKVRFVTIDEENVYIQATSGVVTGFDNEIGRRLWARQLGPRDAPSFQATSNVDDVMIVSGMTISSIEKFGGGVNWQVRLPKQPSASPAADDQNVYVGALDGSIYALDLKKIEELYIENLLPDYAAEAVRWRYKTAAEVTTPAVTDGFLVNFASRDGSLYGISAGQRKLLWQFETNEPVSAPMGRGNDSVIFACEDFRVYSIAKNGRVNWDFVSGFPVRRAPRVVGEQLFLFPERGGLFCLALETGKKLWWRPRLIDFVGATRNRLFVSDRTGNIVILSRRDGAVVGSLPLYKFPIRPSNERTNRLYLATQGGLIVCIREIGQEFPVYHLYPEQLPILPEFEAEQQPESETGVGDSVEATDSDM